MQIQDIESTLVSFVCIQILMPKISQKEQQQENLKATKRLYTVKGDRLEGREAKPGFTDADELDFEEDFADDEETPIIEGDEEELKAVTVCPLSVLLSVFFWFILLKRNVHTVFRGGHC